MAGTGVDNYSYILMKDICGEKAPGKLMSVIRGGSKEVQVLRGELLTLIPPREVQPRNDGKPPHNFRVKKEPNITLYGGDEDTDVAPLGKLEAELLEAISKPYDRFATFSEDDKLDWGGKQNKGDWVYVKIPGDNTSVPDWSIAVVQYAGKVHSLPGRNFGVEIKDPRYCGKGSTNGFFQEYQYFHCDENCGLIVSLDKLAEKPNPQVPQGPQGAAQQQLLSQPRSSTLPPRMTNPPKQPTVTPRGNSSHDFDTSVDSRHRGLEQQPFKVNEHMAVYNKKGEPVYGKFRWAGTDIQTRKLDSLHIGIETDEIVSSHMIPKSIPGTSNLFHAKHGHHLVVPAEFVYRQHELQERGYGKKGTQPLKKPDNVDLSNPHSLARTFGKTERQLIAEEKKILKEAEQKKKNEAKTKKSATLEELKVAVGESINVSSQRKMMEAIEKEKREQDKAKLSQPRQQPQSTQAGGGIKKQHSWQPTRNDHLYDNIPGDDSSSPGTRPRLAKTGRAESIGGARVDHEQAHEQQLGLNQNAGKHQGEQPDATYVNQNIPQSGHHQQWQQRDYNSQQNYHQGDQQYDNGQQSQPPQGGRTQYAGQSNIQPPLGQDQHLPSNAQQHNPYDQGRLTQYPSQFPSGSEHHPPFNAHQQTPGSSQFIAHTGNTTVPFLEVGSAVQLAIVERNAPPRYGVIKWIGTVPQVQGEIAGIELEEYMDGCNDGTLQSTGQKHFDCPPGHGLYFPLANLKPDERFSSVPTSAGPGLSTDGNPLQVPMEEEVDQHIEDASQQMLKYLGEKKGIQGHQNSCYLDSTVFGLFALSDVFDTMFLDANKTADQNRIAISNLLWRGIVNPLRKNGVVRFESVMMLRNKLDELGKMEGIKEKEKDPEEFLNMLFKHMLRTTPFISIKRPFGVEQEFFVQLFVEFDENLRLPTVGDLLRKMFLEQQISFTKVPSRLLIQVPRFGREFKTYQKIVPDIKLRITELTDTFTSAKIPGCFICGKKSLLKCLECDPMPNVYTYYCEDCSKTFHRNPVYPDRAKHTPQDAVDVGTVSELDLLSVICIETSHYVCFTRDPRDEQHKWIFFDSMADRQYDTYNIPKVTDCTAALNEWVYPLNGGRTRLMSTQPRQLPELVRRFTQDVYMCVYIQPDVAMYGDDDDPPVII